VSWAAQARLTEFRGGFPVAPLDVRRVAGLLDVPGCVRRQVVDAATVHMEALARLLGCPPAGRSPFAIARDRRFAQLVTGDAMGPVLALVRERLGAPVTEVRQLDLSADQVRHQYVRGDVGFRASLTSRYVAEMLDGDRCAVNLLRHPILTLSVGGAPIYVEPDVVSYTSTDPLHPVEIRSYPCVDGVADPGRVSVTAREVAVHVLATRELAATLGHPPDRVGTAGLLVLPRNFTLTATGELVDVAPQARRLRRALDAFPEPATLVARVPPGVALPALPARDAAPSLRAAAVEQATEAVSALPPRFGDGCPSCGLFAFCRAEQQATGSVARVGTAAANRCGEVATVGAALGLAHGRRAAAGPAERAVAADLGRAAAMAAWACET
jgi:hypothetical protein